MIIQVIMKMKVCIITIAMVPALGEKGVACGAS